MQLPINPTSKQLQQAFDAFKGAPIALCDIIALAPGESSRLNDDAMINPTTYVMEVRELRWALSVTIDTTGGGL